MQNRINPECPYFGVCGGCEYQHLPYADELAEKHRKLRELFARAGSPSLQHIEIQPVVASPRDYRYRHRLDLSLRRFKNGEIRIGYYRKDNPNFLLEVDQCPIGMAAVSDAIPRLKHEAIARLPDKYRTANLTLRCGQDGRVDWGGIGRGSLRRKDPADWLSMDLNGKRVAFSMDTFFQANFSILPLLEDYLQKLLSTEPPALFLDLYGGVGLFSLMAAPVSERVILIEENPSSVEVARENLRQLPERMTVELRAGRVEDHLHETLADEPDLTRCQAMVDPPRKGLSEAARQLLQDSLLTRILYLSCEPEALVRDLDWFIARGWEVDLIQPFDFFPRTVHLETLARMRRPFIP